MSKSFKAPQDPNGQHVRIYKAVYNSPAWRVLPYSATALYVDLRTKMGSTNNGTLTATLGEFKHRGYRSSATLSAGLKALEAVGLIAKTRQGGIAWASKVCSMYRFTDQDVFDHKAKLGIGPIKATHDYKKFDSVHAAQTALDEVRMPKRRSKVQKLKPIDSINESFAGKYASETEQGAPELLQ